MYAVTAGQMKDIENNAIQTLGIPSLVLMENAAIKTTNHVLNQLNPHDRIAVVCGPGNNGGDGYAIARQLFTHNKNIQILSAGEPQTDDAKLNFDLCKRLGIPFLMSLETPMDLIVDAVFGIGLRRPPEGIFAETIRAMNRYGKKIVSVDIPSGFCADTGKALGETVCALATVTFGYMKRGLLLYPCAENAGEIYVAPISIPDLEFGGGPLTKVLEETDIKKLLPMRKPTAHKGNHGRVCILAGSAAMPGAAVLSCTAAYRIGAGLVDACVPEAVAGVIHHHLPEAISSSRNQINLSAATAVLFGPGLGTGEKDLLNHVVEKINSPLVLDADGLNMLAEEITLLRRLPVPCVLTPHPLEMNRLTGLEINQILNDPIKAACDFAHKHNVHVLLKGARTVIAAPDGNTFINTTGDASLAKAGTGDVLAGIIAGLIAQGMDVFEAAATAAYLHGKAGEAAGRVFSKRGVLAGDLVDFLPLP
jgi:NAD(P)H-hydrate epimerase